VNREATELAAYLQAKREAEGLLQQEQAEKIGIAPEQLTRYIKGVRKPKKDLQKILDYYGTTDEERWAIYSTQISQEELDRAETALKREAEVTPLELAVWIKYGI
jgi:transcriptional regulator with XRE-family HTH domain